MMGATIGDVTDIIMFFAAEFANKYCCFV